jgi:hypothetical protein
MRLSSLRPWRMPRRLEGRQSATQRVSNVVSNGCSTQKLNDRFSSHRGLGMNLELRVSGKIHTILDYTINSCKSIRGCNCLPCKPDLPPDRDPAGMRELASLEVGKDVEEASHGGAGPAPLLWLFRRKRGWCCRVRWGSLRRRRLGGTIRDDGPSSPARVSDPGGHPPGREQHPDRC